MHRVFGAWLLFLFLAVGGVSAGYAESGGTSAGPGGRAPQGGVAVLARQLASQVGEISHSSMISRQKKEKRIATAVRVAVVAATAYKQDPDEILGIAVTLAAEAARAAPPFTEVIAKAVSFAPAIAGIDGASSRIRTAAFAAAKPRETRRQRTVPVTEYAQMAAPPPAIVEVAPVQPQLTPPETEMTATPVTTEPEAPSPAVNYAAGENTASSSQTNGSKAYLGSNSAINLTAELGAKYDDNVFWTQTNKVGDTIMSVAPGAEYRFGQNSLAHGGINYKETFARYLNNSAPQVDLGTGSADFGYADEIVTLAGTASYSQLDQNNPDILAEQRRTLLRSDVFNVGANAESRLTPKISAKLGADYSHTDYKTPGLVSTQHEDLPLSVYFITTPKLDLSTGVTYSLDRPDGGGPTGKNMYYNVGLRGALTQKLGAVFSVGEQTQKVADNPMQHLLGLDGSFIYEVTSKTNAVLAVSRGSGVSALGESLVNGSYRLGLTTDLTPRWQIGADLAYRTVDYGSAVYTPPPYNLPLRRKDNYWESGLTVSYLYSQWLTASANYMHRNNQSTISGAEFSDNVLSLMLGLRY
jgi:hypothetical protein